MRLIRFPKLLFTICWLLSTAGFPQSGSGLTQLVPNPPSSAKPWVFWYWMQAGVSKAGITADLEAMQAAGIGGAYLMPIQGAKNPPVYTPVAEQLTPHWWDLVRHAMQEAKRLKLEMGMHVSDGFALAGGPWITPELSMQKVVYATTQVQGNQPFSGVLPQPPTQENYYKDIAVFAIPAPPTIPSQPVITSSQAGNLPQFLIDPTNKQAFRSDTVCWIQYAYEQPVTVRSLLVRTPGNNVQAHRLKIEASNDGKTFRPVTQLQPPRHGWQDTDADVTHAIPATTARYFRFIYDKKGSEPGAEDLDAAKWKPTLKLTGLELSAEPKIHQYEGKSALVWRVSPRSTEQQLPRELCVPLNKIINLTSKLKADGRLDWQAPAGTWTIIRMGHTSTGHTNATAGAGKGLECDKFNPQAITLQFNRWFGEAQRQIGPSKDVLKVLHVDSWECGSQNWSVTFPAEFKKRRGYDMLPYLPVLAGIPLVSAETSEQVLYDLRRTVAELVVDKFYTTLAGLAKQHGVQFSAESVAPTMTSDGLAHYRKVDIPMGEFWLNSPTHDKPNDMLDATSAAHIYGKNIVQAEGFTTVRMDWSEHPGMLKTLQDRNYALGINKLVYHVFSHNPWLDRRPGMTLDGVGLYFQRDQTWWKPGRAWVEYARRCQTLLQLGKPVADIAVFTGDDLPRRSVLPDRLINTLPGIFGNERVQSEARRLANAGEPLRVKPLGVSHSANMADPEHWVDPLRGYTYDSFSTDALTRLATVSDSSVRFAPGTAYRIVVVPGRHPLNVNQPFVTPETASKLVALVKAGATVLIEDQALFAAGKGPKEVSNELWEGRFEMENGLVAKTLGKGRVIQLPYELESFASLGIERDVAFTETNGSYAQDLAWTHRRNADMDLYFIGNQQEKVREITASFRIRGKQPELYNAVTDELMNTDQWRMHSNRTEVTLRLEPNASVFVIFRKPTKQNEGTGQVAKEPQRVQTLSQPWQVQFDPAFGGPVQPQIFTTLSDWSQHTDASIRYYSGTATYTQTFQWSDQKGRYWLDLGKVANMAEVKLNGQSCGVAWTFPYRVELTQYLKAGENQLQIEVSNTWANRLIGDHRLPEKQRITHTTAPYRLEGRPLLEAGLRGPVQIITR
ncbi:glycosyl hydrolase [Siphonobacter sp.]|uniref:glycosyl hydrolase n=1 Tax=Siphonobacter sp. TaxID=1869184 RepID=UPI003B3B72F6